MTEKDLRDLAAQLSTQGSEPNVIHIRPETKVAIDAAAAEYERRAKHWYWRAWWHVLAIRDRLSDWADRAGEWLAS